MVSLETVYDWLDDLHYQFIYDPEYPLEAYESNPALQPLRGTTGRAPGPAPAVTAAPR
jgi:hypothetical protein